MSERGMQFHELWVLANVKAGGNAAKLAVRCAADALTLGISLQEIEEESDPLEAIIAQANRSSGRWRRRGDRK